MTRRTRVWLARGALGACVLGAVGYVALRLGARHSALRSVGAFHELPADGREHAVARIIRRFPAHVASDSLTVSGLRSARPEDDEEAAEIFVRAPVLPGPHTLHVKANDGRGHLTLPLTFTPDIIPSAAQPSLPDWMPLHAPEDRSAFRRWIVGLAESTVGQPAAELPPEIIDCAALLRYAYREALRDHDANWSATAPASERLNLPSVAQWNYPNTPLGAALFRTRLGTFTSADITNSTFTQFADAKTLASANTYFISRDLAQARPGDLLFFRLLQLDSHHNQQYHSMIVTGGHAEWVIYHTGPVTSPGGTETRGEIRRVLLRDLLHHPDPRWRPEPGNTNFLGVYRWTILGEE